MPFPNQPNPYIRAWDRYAGEAAVIAQLFFSAGILSYPFNSRLFDRTIHRQPNQFLYSAQWLRIIASELPSVVVWRIGPETMDTIVSASDIRKSVAHHGHNSAAADSILMSSSYVHAVIRSRNITRATRALKSRHRRVISNEAHGHAKALLASGALIIACSQVDLLDTPLLIWSDNGIFVYVFKPRSGIERIRLSTLIEEKVVDLDTTGFYAYEMN